MLILSPSHPSSHPLQGPTFRWPAMPGPPQSHQWEAEICGVTTAFESWLNGVLNKNRKKLIESHVKLLKKTRAIKRKNHG